MERGQGDLLGGYDRNGRLHAAAFVVWQESSAYYLAGGADPALRDSGAHSLVLWEAIQAMAAHTSLFDFEGSMLPGVERFFREFGAFQTPYYTITKGKLCLLDRVRIKLYHFK
jgi:lipid II:glycine glycyltransferase (peptidoglycan interpeptide bridge formation enzyme)